MAAGDITVFEEAKLALVAGGWEAADTIKLALVTNSPAVTAASAVPAVGSGGTTNFTEVAGTGAYTTGGETLDTLGNMTSEAAGVMTFDDTGTTVTWAQNGSSPQTAVWGIIYHDPTNLAIAMIELIDGTSAVDMQAGDLTLTWSTSPNAIFTIE